MKIKLRFLIIPVLLTACSTSQIANSRVGNCQGPFVDQKKLNGIYTCYFPDGKLSGRFMYKDGTKNGVSEVYSDAGFLTSTIEYQNNWLDGTTKEFSGDGHLKVESHFKEGRQHGEYTEYWGNEKVKSHTIFENGNEIGPASYFDKNGVKVSPPAKEAP